MAGVACLPREGMSEMPNKLSGVRPPKAIVSLVVLKLKLDIELELLIALTSPDSWVFVESDRSLILKR